MILLHVLLVYMVAIGIWCSFCVFYCYLDRLRLMQYADDESDDEVVDAEPITSQDEINIKIKLTTNDIIC